ncbi:MAG: efflux RND transporter permease subunit [Christensenellales bacterium]|jgi:predicted RND superfamily exporter protein
MRKYSRFVVNNKLIVMIVFIVITLVISIFIPFVRVNYDDTSYLPKKSNVSQSLDEMYNSFGYGGNVAIMFKDISIAQGVRNKNQIMEIKAKRVIDGRLIKKETVDPINQIVWVDSLILARELNLWKLVDTMVPKEEVDENGKIAHPAGTGERITPYTNVELVAYVWEMGRSLITLFEDTNFTTELADAGMLGSIDVIKTKLNTIMMSDTFKQNVYNGSPLEKPEFFDKLFAEDPNNPGENDFLNKVLPVLQTTITTMVVEGKIAIPDDMSEGMGSFDISMLSEQLAPFWKQNAGQSIGTPTGNGSALFQVMFTYSDYDDATVDAISQIRKLNIGAHVVGNAAVVANSIEAVQSITMKSMAFAFVVVIVILLLTTNSFWEPVLLLITIGAAILLNMGTNIVMWNGVSYMTQGVASVLQLALTMDYSIYLLNRFKQEKQRGLTSNEAMVEALTRSLSPVSSASLTTVASFVALCFMSYKLGLDMGFVLMKGVIFSLISVFVFMPTLILMTEKLMYKTAHKTINFSFKRFSKFLIKTRFYIPILILALVVPSYIFQKQNKFTYGQEASLEGPKAQITTDKEAMRQVFGEQNQVVVLLPEDAEFTSQEVKVVKMQDGKEYIVLPEVDVEGDIKSETIMSRESLLYEKLNALKVKNNVGLPVVLGVQSFQQIADTGAAGIIPANLKAQMVVVDNYDDRGIRSFNTDHIMIDKTGDIYVIENGRYRLKRTAEEDRLAKEGFYTQASPLSKKDKSLYYEYKNVSEAGKPPIYKYVLVKYDNDTKTYENVLADGKIQTRDLKATTYRRVVMFLPLPQEGEKTTKAIEDIEAIIVNIYGDQASKAEDGQKRAYTIGQSVATLEIKALVNNDYDIISAISVVLVFLILLGTYKAILLPILMILVIQSSIYFNMVIPYIRGEAIVFVGYMMVSSILLGTTIDYAIVLVSHYMECREKHNKYDSVQQALAMSSRTLITSGGILTFAGISTNIVNKDVSPATAMFGSMVARGGIASLILVFVLLPQLLLIFDTPIRYTTWKGKTRMIENRLAKPLHQIAEKGKIETEKRSKKVLTPKERERAIIDSILRGIRDKDYDPDTFTFEDYIKDTPETKGSSKAPEDTKPKKIINMYDTLQESLGKKDESNTKLEFFTDVDLVDMAESVAPVEDEILSDSKAIDKPELVSSAVAATKDSTKPTELLGESKKEGASYSEIYDILVDNKPMVRKSTGTSRAQISKKPSSPKTRSKKSTTKKSTPKKTS